MKYSIFSLTAAITASSTLLAQDIPGKTLEIDEAIQLVGFEAQNDKLPSWATPVVDLKKLEGAKAKPILMNGTLLSIEHDGAFFIETLSIWNEDI